MFIRMLYGEEVLVSTSLQLLEQPILQKKSGNTQLNVEEKTWKLFIGAIDTLPKCKVLIQSAVILPSHQRICNIYNWASKRSHLEQGAKVVHGKNQNFGFIDWVDKVNWPP